MAAMVLYLEMECGGGNKWGNGGKAFALSMILMTKSNGIISGGGGGGGGGGGISEDFLSGFRFRRRWWGGWPYGQGWCGIGWRSKPQTG